MRAVCRSVSNDRDSRLRIRHEPFPILTPDF